MIAKYVTRNYLFALCCTFVYILLWRYDSDITAPTSTTQSPLSPPRPTDGTMGKSSESPSAYLAVPQIINSELTEKDLRRIQLLKRKKVASSSLALIIGSSRTSNQSTSPPQELKSLWHRPEGTNARHRCFDHECKFLFAGDIAEQLSASSFHMDQIAHLAARFARVLILPRVGSSRFHVCKQYPFSAYFEPTSYDSVPGLDWIHEDEFFDILGERMQRWQHENEADHVELEQDDEDLPTTYITTEHILFISAAASESQKNHIPTWAANNKALKCHQQRNKSFKKGVHLILPGANPVTVMVAPSKTEVGMSRDKLRKDVFALGDRWKTIDVVLVTWKWQEHILFPDVGYFTEDKTSVSMLQYSSELWAQAYRAASLMRPYATVHWRMELTDPEWMPSCAEALVQFLENGERSNSTVFLANDLPVDGHPASGTFRKPDVLHLRARDHLASQIGRLKTWRSLGLDGIASVNPASAELPDNGLLGIIDKLIASLSDEFIGGPKYCSRSVSSYTRGVASMRELVRNGVLAFPLSGDNAPFVPSNVISHWPIPSFKEKRAALEAVKKEEVNVHFYIKNQSGN